MAQKPYSAVGGLLIVLAATGPWQAAALLLTQASSPGEQPSATAAPGGEADVPTAASEASPEAIGAALRTIGPGADAFWPDALAAGDASHLQRLFGAGVAVACCGRWRDQAAARLQGGIAAKLGLPVTRLGDVHLSNSSMIVSGSGSGDWGAVAVVYLGEAGDAQAELAGPYHALGGLAAPRAPAPRSAVLVADGEKLLHSKPVCLAWVRIRADGKPGRSLFDWYVASWIRRNFVAPYDTVHQRKFFRAHTRYPMYWHGFVWSFVGMFCTVFACLPLAWWGVQLAERLSGGAALAPGAGGPAFSAEYCRPLTPGKRPPTLLPLVGPEACKQSKAQGAFLAASLKKAVD